MVGLLLLGPMTAALAWAVVEITKVEDRGRATLRWLGPIALSVVAWCVACMAAFGSVEELWNRLDAGEVAGSLLWSTLGQAVLAAGAIAFVSSRRRGFESHKTLALADVALLLAGLPVLFMVAATSFI